MVEPVRPTYKSFVRALCSVSATLSYVMCEVQHVRADGSVALSNPSVL